MPWRCALYGLRHFGIAVALAVALLLPESDCTHRSETSKERPRFADESRVGFSLLFAICVLDSAVRMGFLPFLLEAKGTSLPEIGFALALVFIGGAAGKFACGWLRSRFNRPAIFHHFVLCRSIGGPALSPTHLLAGGQKPPPLPPSPHLSAARLGAAILTLPLIRR